MKLMKFILIVDFFLFLQLGLSLPLFFLIYLSKDIYLIYL